MNVIFSVPTFSLLNALGDGWFVLYSDQTGSPHHTIGPFSTVAEARDWATKTGAREGVRIDGGSFSRWGDT